MANYKPNNYRGLNVKELMDMNDFKQQLSHVVPIILKARMENGFANCEKWQEMQVLDEAGGDIKNEGSFSTVDIAVYLNFLRRCNDQYRGKIQSRVRKFFPH